MWGWGWGGVYNSCYPLINPSVFFCATLLYLQHEYLWTDADLSSGRWAEVCLRKEDRVQMNGFYCSNMQFRLCKYKCISIEPFAITEAMNMKSLFPMQRKTERYTGRVSGGTLSPQPISQTQTLLVTFGLKQNNG